MAPRTRGSDSVGAVRSTVRLAASHKQLVVKGVDGKGPFPAMLPCYLCRLADSSCMHHVSCQYALPHPKEYKQSKVCASH